MMLRKKSNQKTQWRALAALPALGLAALLLSTPVIADGLQNVSTAEITKKNVNEDSQQQHNNVITISSESTDDTKGSSRMPMSAMSIHRKTTASRCKEILSSMPTTPPTYRFSSTANRYHEKN